MLCELLIFVLTTLLVYYLYRHKQAHRHFERRGVRFFPGVPVFGNVLRSTFSKKHILEELGEVYNAFPDDKYVGFIEYTKPVLLIRDPDLIKNITIKDFDHFTDHPEPFEPDLDPLFGRSLLLLKGEKWRHMRNTLSPVFTRSKMIHIMPFILDNTNNIVEYLEEHATEDTDVDDLMHRYTNDVIASAAFGLRVNSLRDRDNEFYTTGVRIFDFNWRQKMKVFLMFQFPKLAEVLGMTFLPKTMRDFFKNIVSSAMEYRRKEHVERQDLIQLLMEAKRGWTLDDLTSQVFIFFIAGFETGASALIMCTHELAINPVVQERLYQEVRKHQEAKELRFDNINELTYLDCVINESLRKWAPAPIFDRVCVKTYEFPPPRDGAEPIMLRPGDVIFNMENSIHMDERYFPEPNTFNPDRFSDENKHNMKPFTHMPFGFGPRNCIGTRFALLEIKVLLYHLILNFRFQKTERTHDPMVLKAHRFIIKAVGGTWVKFVKRN